VSLAALIVLLLVVLITIPEMKKKEIAKHKIINFIMPFFVAITSLLSFFDQFSHSNDSLVISLLFIFLLINKKTNTNSYLLNISSLFSSIILLIYVDKTIWLSIGLFVLIILNSKKYNVYLGIVSFLIMLLPLSPQFEYVYYQWGGIILIPALIGLITSKDSFKRSLFGFLYIVSISDTRYMTLGYYPILIVGISLLLILLTLEKEEEPYIYSLALVPFIGISNLYNLIALYVLFEVVMYFKGEVLNIVNNIETENGTIKNIRYHEIAMVLIGIYILFSGPASPFAWLFHVVKADYYVMALVLLIELILLNQVCIERSADKVRADFDTNKTEVVRVVIYLAFSMLSIGSDIFNYNVFGVIPGLIFILILVINKKNKSWANLLTVVKKSVSISQRNTVQEFQRSPIEDRGRAHKMTSIKMGFSGIDESIIWSVFILIISIILIGRYL